MKPICDDNVDMRLRNTIRENHKYSNNDNHRQTYLTTYPIVA